MRPFYPLAAISAKKKNAAFSPRFAHPYRHRLKAYSYANTCQFHPTLLGLAWAPQNQAFLAKPYRGPPAKLGLNNKKADTSKAHPRVIFSS